MRTHLAGVGGAVGNYVVTTFDDTKPGGGTDQPQGGQEGGQPQGGDQPSGGR